MFLIKPDAIPEGVPTSISEIVFYTPPGKPRTCEIQDLAQALNLDLSSEIEQSINSNQSWEIQNGNFNAIAFKKYLINNISGNREVQLPVNPSVGQVIEFVLLGTNPVLFRTNGQKYIGTDFDIRSNVRFGLIELVYSGSSLGWIPTISGNQSINGSIHSWVSNGDTNGILQFYGTTFGTQAWTNPHTAGRLTITHTSGVSTTNVAANTNVWSNLLGFPNNTVFDFITRQVIPNRMTWQNSSNGTTSLRSFNLDGSNDNSNWQNIQYFVNVGSNVNGAINGVNIVAPLEAYRYLRIRMDNNGTWNNTTSLSLGRVEFYGTTIII